MSADAPTMRRFSHIQGTREFAAVLRTRSHRDESSLGQTSLSIRVAVRSFQTVLANRKCERPSCTDRFGPIEPFAGEHSKQNDEAGKNSDQADQHVNYRVESHLISLLFCCDC